MITLLLFIDMDVWGMFGIFEGNNFIVFFISIIISNIAVFQLEILALNWNYDKYEKRKDLDRWRFYNAWMLYINLSFLISFRFSVLIIRL